MKNQAAATNSYKEGLEMEKNDFLSVVTDVMKVMVSHEDMMASMYRSGMRGEARNIEHMTNEEERLDRFIEGLKEINEISIDDDLMDTLILRYLRNTHYLADIKEEYIDVSSLGNKEINFWKKALLFKPAASSRDNPGDLPSGSSNEVPEAC